MHIVPSPAFSVCQGKTRTVFVGFSPTFFWAIPYGKDRLFRYDYNSIQLYPYVNVRFYNINFLTAR